VGVEGMMALTKSKGNMYPWVTHTHTHLGGECPHQCSYCYVNSFPFGRPTKYQGPLRLIEKEFSVNYGKGKTIFVEHCNDLFAAGVPDGFKKQIFEHCSAWPSNTYVFQTKNPRQMARVWTLMPPDVVLGTTIESNRYYPQMNNAPIPLSRVRGMKMLPPAIRKFVTIEPVMDFDVDILASWIDQIRPEFLNLGADSKNNNLPEPTLEKIMEFTEKLGGYGIELREKHNLQRLKP
jgi:DNA repair photolyase